MPRRLRHSHLPDLHSANCEFKSASDKFQTDLFFAVASHCMQWSSEHHFCSCTQAECMGRVHVHVAHNAEFQHEASRTGAIDRNAVTGRHDARPCPIHRHTCGVHRRCLLCRVRPQALAIARRSRGVCDGARPARVFANIALRLVIALRDSDGTGRAGLGPALRGGVTGIDGVVEARAAGERRGRGFKDVAEEDSVWVVGGARHRHDDRVRARVRAEALPCTAAQCSGKA
jgi:hypothetical protein